LLAAVGYYFYNLTIIFLPIKGLSIAAAGNIKIAVSEIYIAIEKDFTVRLVLIKITAIIATPDSLQSRQLSNGYNGKPYLPPTRMSSPKEQNQGTLITIQSFYALPICFALFSRCAL
jgi:hypothetical protein